jgi:hypothetical protein
MSVRYAGLLAVAGAVAIVAGCGTVQASQRPGPSPDVTAHSAPRQPVAHSAPQQPVAPEADVTARPAPRQQAVASAAAMLAAFIPPPHAVRTGPLPVSWLARPVGGPAVPDLVTRTGWWRVTGQPQAVLEWIQAHKLPGSKVSTGGGVTVRGGYVMWYSQFTLPAVPGVLTGRELVAAVAADGPGRTALQVDAYVQWLPPRTAAEAIPASARVVTIAPIAAAGQQVTVTDPARVARIAAAVNALPLYPQSSEPMWCDILYAPGSNPPCS